MEKYYKKRTQIGGNSLETDIKNQNSSFNDAIWRR